MAQEIADIWIQDDREFYASDGWVCYEWLLGYKPDEAFDRKKIETYLKLAEKMIHSQRGRVRYAMNRFVIAVGISFQPLHKEAVRVAASIGEVGANQEKASSKLPIASIEIQKAADKHRLGFKRKNVRC